MKRLIAVLLCLLMLAACGTPAPVEEAPAEGSPGASLPAPAPEPPTEAQVTELLRKAESIYQSGNYDTLTVASYENYIDDIYYDEVGGYEEATAEVFTQNGIEQLESTEFLQIPLIRKQDDKFYRASAMTDSAILTCYEVIDDIALVAQDSGNCFYEITHTPLPKGYTAEEKYKLSTLVSPLTIVWEDGRWKVDFFDAFGQDAIASGTPFAPDEIEDKGQLPGHIAAVPEPTALTDEEIARVNDAFEPIIDNKVNPLGLFLMSWYQSPAQFNLTEFLRYFPDSQMVDDPAEFEALKAHENWNWPKDAKLDMMPVPIHRIPAAEVEALLQQHMGVGIQDITYSLGSDLLYLEEYNCFYNFTSDAGFGMFECVSGDITGDTLTLTGTDCILTMKQSGENWLFYSFIPVE